MCHRHAYNYTKGVGITALYHLHNKNITLSTTFLAKTSTFHLMSFIHAGSLLWKDKESTPKAINKSPRVSICRLIQAIALNESLPTKTHQRNHENKH